MGRKGTKSIRKKKKTHLNAKSHGVDEEPSSLVQAPHSFVLHRGSVGDAVADLTLDFRKVMEPFTASSLKERKVNTIKDYLSVAGVLHVSHISIFSMTELGTYMKLARVPRGPTLYFRVLNFCLARDVISSLKRQMVSQKLFDHPPLVILNNFSGNDVQMKLMASMFQNMFPAINLAKINLNHVKRCVMFNYRPEEEEIDFRHYTITVVPVGVSKGVKKIVQSRVPNLAKFEDISELITKSQLLSESEGEDDPTSHVTLPQELSSRGNIPLEQSSIRLSEIGPRMTLQLNKIEDGFMSGDVLYHRHIVRTDKEKASILKKRMEKMRLKEERKRIQAQAVRRKEEEKEKHKLKSLEGMKKKTGEEGEDQEDDDAAWYESEVSNGWVKEEKEKHKLKSLEGMKKKTGEEGEDQEDDDAAWYESEVSNGWVKEEKEKHKLKSLERMKKKTGEEGEDQEDDDAAWYESEVGKAPEHDLFDKKQHTEVKFKPRSKNTPSKQPFGDKGRQQGTKRKAEFKRVGDPKKAKFSGQQKGPRSGGKPFKGKPGRNRPK